MLRAEMVGRRDRLGALPAARRLQSMIKPKRPTHNNRATQQGVDRPVPPSALCWASSTPRPDRCTCAHQGPSVPGVEREGSARLVGRQDRVGALPVVERDEVVAETLVDIVLRKSRA